MSAIVLSANRSGKTHALIQSLSDDLVKERARVDWLLSLEGRQALHWAVENGEPFTREDIDAKRGAN